MRSSRIGGTVDYRALAQLHRPDDAGLRLEVVRLAREGLEPADIAMALRLHVNQVKGWLADGHRGGPA